MNYTTIETFDEKGFQEERKNGIGGSELGDILGLDQYACQRKLWYKKKNFEIDYKRDDYALRRGKRLEPVARSYFEETSGRKVKHSLPTFALKDSPHIRVNLDGLVLPQIDGEECLVLEIKTLGVDSFERIKKLGIPETYVSQIQYGMGIAGVKKGVFVIYSPEYDDLTISYIDFNESIFNGLKEAASNYWNNFIVGQYVPAQIEHEEDSIPTVCKNCEYRKKCKNLGSNGKPLQKDIF